MIIHKIFRMISYNKKFVTTKKLNNEIFNFSVLHFQQIYSYTYNVQSYVFEFNFISQEIKNCKRTYLLSVLPSIRFQ